MAEQSTTGPVQRKGELAPAVADEFAEGELVLVLARVLKPVSGDPPDIAPGLLLRFDTTFHRQGAHYWTIPLRSIRKVAA